MSQHPYSQGVLYEKDTFEIALRRKQFAVEAAHEFKAILVPYEKRHSRSCLKEKVRLGVAGLCAIRKCCPRCYLTQHNQTAATLDNLISSATGTATHECFNLKPRTQTSPSDHADAGRRYTVSQPESVVDCSATADSQNYLSDIATADAQTSDSQYVEHKCHGVYTGTSQRCSVETAFARRTIHPSKGAA